jgi:hypothetical protein
MNLNQYLTRPFCLAALAFAVAAIFAIDLAPAQDRRQDRRPDRYNVVCDVPGFDGRSAVRFDDPLIEVDRLCRRGDIVVLGSPELVARLCDFSWSVAMTGAGATVCVFGGVREVMR